MVSIESRAWSDLCRQKISAPVPRSPDCPPSDLVCENAVNRARNFGKYNNIYRVLSLVKLTILSAGRYLAFPNLSVLPPRI